MHSECLVHLHSPEAGPAKVPYELFLTACIASHAPGGGLAVADGKSTLTFGELEHQANQLAAHLLEAGCGPESCVGLLLDRSTEFVVSALAVLKTGAAYLPLDSATPPERASFILTDAGASVLLTHHVASRQLPVGRWRTIELDGPDAAHIAARPGDSVCIEPAPSSLAYIIYTSGSTGRPKGVEITHANLMNLIAWHQKAFNVTAADRASQVAGLGFDAAVWEIWPYLAAGASVHLADEMTRRSAQALQDWIIAEKITMSFVPTVLAEHLLNESWPAQSALRILLTGADTLHRRPAESLPFVLVNNYGPSECTVVATSGAVASDREGSGAPPIGRPIDGAVVLILDETLRPVTAGEAGELCIGGTLVGRGYRNNPDLTAARFVSYRPVSGPSLRIYRTGDRARMLASGEIAFLGRLDEQVKIRGYRIELGEIAACLDRYPGIEASTVVLGEDAGGPALIAYIATGKDARLSAADLREFLAKRLPDYMIPARFVKLASLPMTANGKLDKSALPALAAENLLTNPTDSSPVSKGDGNVEPKIAEMVASLLGVPSVGSDDNFFMLGGHSMLGVQLAARIREMFSVKVSLRQLFTSPTISGLSAEVARLIEAGR